MREIKFRAWDKVNKRMLFRTIWDKNWYLTPKNDAGGCHCDRGITPDDRAVLELMQFTGLLDKNGKEIYEGDIVKAGEDVCRVGWNHHYASFCLDKNGWMFSHFFGEAVDIEDVEVIGNIYESPKFLKEE